MRKENRDTAGIWAEQLGDAHVGCYGLLDYSATTPVNKDVLESYSNACLKYIGNPNSLHKLGVEASNLIDRAIELLNAVYEGTVEDTKK